MRIRDGICVILLIITGCSTDIDLISDGGSIPLVYCLLDPDKPFQYVRIGSTYAVFPGDTTNKPTQDEILVDEEIIVYLTAEFSDRKQEVYYGHLIDTIPKDSGWFPSTVNQIYAIPCTIKPDTKYSLYIKYTGTNRIVHGETTSFGSTFTIIDPDKVPGREANLLNGIDYYVRFQPVINGSIFQSTMTFRYADIKDGQWTIRSLVFPQRVLIEMDTTVIYASQRISGRRFLIDVSRALQPEPDTRRVPLGLDFQISCGGDDLALKINAENNAQSFSILDVNSFDNAIGVFSCLVHRFIKDVPISHFTIDTLAMGPLTRHLGFLTAQQIDLLHHENN